MSDPSFKLNPTAASFEDFGDEIVVIHNESGVFYSIKGRAIAIWRALEGGVDGAAADAQLRAISAEEADAVKQMLTELSSRNILVRVAEPAGPLDDLAASPLGPARFESFSDFDDLIRLDPIHDVDERGWPHRKTEPH